MNLSLTCIAATAMLLAGCASDSEALRHDQEHKVARGDYFLAASNAPAGSFYELGIYVITAGDTIAKVASRFQVPVSDIMTVNPGLNPTRLYIGQKIRVYEKRKE